VNYDYGMGATIEVEKKARVADPPAVAAALLKLGRLEGEIDYRDLYFTRAEVEGYTPYRFRLRRTAGRAFVTYKERLPGGVDACREHEFEVSDPDAFIRLALLFGLRVMMTKEKRGRRFVVEAGAVAGLCRPVRAELVEIRGLGEFIEIEALVERPEEVAQAVAAVDALFRALGVPDTAFEPRPYTLMLYALRPAAAGAAPAEKGCR
jgi:predicted adenylyl cyclase CyaB